MDAGERAGRYALSPWSLPVSAWLAAARRAGYNTIGHRLSLSAAGVAFFGFLSLFPALAATVFLYGLFSDIARLGQHLDLLRAVLPPQGVDILAERLTVIVSTPNTAGLSSGFVVSLVFTLWSASRGVAAVVEMLGVAYHQPDRRSFVTFSVLSLVLTFGMLGMLIAALILIAGLPALASGVSGMAPAIALLRWPMLLAGFCAGLVLLYRMAPDRRVARLAWILPGALLATLAWGAMSVLFSLYVQNFGTYDAMFGPLSSIAVLLLWLYYSAFIIGLGAELNAELEMLTRIDTTVGPSRPLGTRGAYVADTVKPPR